MSTGVGQCDSSTGQATSSCWEPALFSSEQSLRAALEQREPCLANNRQPTKDDVELSILAFYGGSTSRGLEFRRGFACGLVRGD
jgi:hypothetical protein